MFRKIIEHLETVILELRVGESGGWVETANIENLCL